MAVILIPEGLGSYNQAIPQTDDRNLVAELIFLVVLAFADTEDVRLVEGVNLVPVNLLSVYELEANAEAFLVDVLFRKQPYKFPQEPSCNGPHLPVRLLYLLRRVFPAPETLDSLKLLEFLGITLPNFQILLFGHCVTKFYYLVQEF